MSLFFPTFSFNYLPVVFVTYRPPGRGHYNGSRACKEVHPLHSFRITVKPLKRTPARSSLTTTCVLNKGSVNPIAIQIGGGGGGGLLRPYKTLKLNNFKTVTPMATKFSDSS